MKTQSEITFQLSLFFREKVLPIGMLSLVLLVIYVAFRSDYNPLTAATLVLSSAMYLTAFVSPKAGMYMLVVVAGYLDLVKRLTIVTGAVGMNDVVAVLRIAPILFVVVALGAAVHGFFRHRFLNQQELPLVAAAACLIGAAVWSTYRDVGSIGETIKYAANTAAYIPLLFIVAGIFQQTPDLLVFIRNSALILLPVPIYGIWQAFFGINAFEYEYVRSGLTMTGDLLSDSRIRPFSTLASPHPLSVVTAMFFCLSLLPWRPRRPPGTWFGVPKKDVIIALIYFAGCIASVGRAGWIIAFAGIAGIVCFGKRSSTLALYAIALVTFLFLFLSAEYVEANLVTVRELLPGESAVTEQMFRLGTLGDRLIGWKNMLHNPEIFTAFGIPKAERDHSTFVHDQFGQILVGYGLVGLCLAILGVSYLLASAHRRTWRVTDPLSRRLAVVTLSIIFAVVFSGALFGGHTHVFPNNVFFWFTAGSLVVALRSGESQRAGVTSSGEDQRAGLRTGSGSVVRALQNSHSLPRIRATAGPAAGGLRKGSLRQPGSRGEKRR